jgi:hypothetical protein
MSLRDEAVEVMAPFTSPDWGYDGDANALARSQAAKALDALLDTLTEHARDQAFFFKSGGIREEPEDFYFAVVGWLSGLKGTEQ